MEPPLSGGPPFEMLHRVRHIHRVAVDARGLQRVVKDTARRTDERSARDVLLVAGLLADEDDLGGPLPFPEDRLGRFRPEVAGSAMGRGIPPRPDTLGLRELGVFMAGLGPGFREVRGGLAPFASVHAS